MVLEGKHSTTPEMLPIIISELQNKSVISIICGYYHFGALTSSGKLLTWGRCSEGALGLGDPSKLSTESSGEYLRGEQWVQAPMFEHLQDVTVPTEVRFDHGLAAKGRVERYCFAAAAGTWSTVALIIDLVGDEVPPEDLEQHFKMTVPHKSTQTTHNQKTCCLM